jgi:hypothetical protein
MTKWTIPCAMMLRIWRVHVPGIQAICHHNSLCFHRISNHMYLVRCSKYFYYCGDMKCSDSKIHAEHCVVYVSPVVRSDIMFPVVMSMGNTANHSTSCITDYVISYTIGLHHAGLVLPPNWRSLPLNGMRRA